MRWYRAKISGGKYAPAMCPRWRGPLAYGHATATSIFSGFVLGMLYYGVIWT
jgi:hypothetical protein